MDPSDLERPLLRLAEAQHSLVADWQVRSLGVARKVWRGGIDRGDWDRVTGRVVRRAGAAPSDSQRAMAAVLDAGPSSYLSHHSAAALWGFPGFRLEPLEVMSVRARGRGSSLASVHLPRHLPDPFATWVDGVPVVRPALVLLQLAPLIHPGKLDRMLDWFWARRLLSGPSVRAELDCLMHRGRAGTVVLRDLLDSKPADYVPPASNLEARFAAILEEVCLPKMRAQVDLGDDESWCGRVDFLAYDLPLVVEVQSDLYHLALSNLDDDARRRARLEAAGFVVLEVREFEIWHRKQEVAEAVRGARRELKSRAHAA